MQFSSMMHAILFQTFLIELLPFVLHVGSGSEKAANHKTMPQVPPCAWTKASSISKTRQTAKELVVGEERSDTEKNV